MAHKARKFFRPFFCHFYSRPPFFLPGLLFRPFSTWSPRVPRRIKREIFFGPFSAIFSWPPFFYLVSFLGHFLPGHLRDHGARHAKIHFLPNNRGELFSTIFGHFRPFSAITCLATLLSITRNTRNSMAANFGQFLQC